MFEDNFPDTCLSCGLLGVRDKHVHNMPIQELSADRRANGLLSDSQFLWCLRGMAPLHRELQNLLDDRPVKPSPETALTQADSVNTVLRRHREPCVTNKVWYVYTQFFSPKETYEEWRMMELEKMRQQQADTMAAIVKEQTAIAKEHAKTASYHATIAEKLATISESADQHTTEFNAQAGRVNRWLLWITIATFFVGGVAALLAGVQVFQLSTEDDVQKVVEVTFTPTPTAIPPTATPIPQPTDTLTEQ